jgi:hypothetical protein
MLLQVYKLSEQESRSFFDAHFAESVPGEHRTYTVAERANCRRGILLHTVLSYMTVSSLLSLICVHVINHHQESFFRIPTQALAAQIQKL